MGAFISPKADDVMTASLAWLTSQGICSLASPRTTTPLPALPKSWAMRSRCRVFARASRWWCGSNSIPVTCLPFSSATPVVPTP